LVAADEDAVIAAIAVQAGGAALSTSWHATPSFAAG